MLRLVAFHMADSEGKTLDEKLAAAQKIYDYMIGQLYVDPIASIPPQNPDRSVTKL